MKISLINNYKEAMKKFNLTIYRENGYMPVDFREYEPLTPKQAIKAKCFDCVGYNAQEVKKCKCYDCALWALKERYCGNTEKEVSEKVKENLRKAREAKNQS